MGRNKTTFIHEAERMSHKEFAEEMDEFFEEEFMTFDVRVTAKIHVPSFNSLIDTKSALRKVKADLRKVMLKQFRAELTKQINDQL